MKDLMAELLARRVPQFVGLYLAGSWAFVEFLDWAVEQFVLSPHISSFAFLLLLLLIPSVVMLAWRHGAPGKDVWGRVEAVGISLNLILAATLLFFSFSGKDLGAATTTVVVEDEAGNEIERQVPKQAFRKKVAIFFFDNESGEEALDWLSFGATLALQVDLAQQMFVISTSPLDGSGHGGILLDLQEAGFADGVGVPLTLMREIADTRHLEYFVTGSFTRSDAGITVESVLYQTRRGNLVNRRTFTGVEPLDLIDQMSEQLRLDLDVPEYKIEESPNLPVSELLTGSPKAFELAAVGFHRIAAGDLSGGLPLLASAVEEDPTFAMAHAQKAGVHLLSNQRPQADSAMQAAMTHLYRLPERTQLGLRTLSQWLFEQDAEKAFRTATYWTELYPDDVQGHVQLAELHSARGEWKETIAELETVLELDPSQYDYILEIGAVHEQGGDFEKALEHYGRYAELLPDDWRSFTAIASVHSSLGEHEQARAAYERAQVIDPDESSIPLALAQLEMDLGDFGGAVRYREQAHAASRSPQDRLAVYGFDASLHYRQGRFDELERDYQHQIATAAEYMNPLNMMIDQANSVLLQYAPEAGREASALRELDRISEQASPPFDGLLGIAYLQIYQGLGNAEQTRVWIDRLDTTIEALGLEYFRYSVHLGSGRVAEIEGDCLEAIASYGKAVEIQPTTRTPRVWIGRCQLALGNPAAAETTLTEILRVTPAFPKARYQLALVYQEMGRTEDAIAQLQAVLEIWKDADPEYIPAQEARARLAELEARG
jgi:tetratricopeptide (TPR) repeat protein